MAKIEKFFLLNDNQCINEEDLGIPSSLLHLSPYVHKNQILKKKKK